MAKVTTTKLGRPSTDADYLQLGGVADGYAGSESYMRQAGLDTTDATQTTIASVSLNENEAIVLEGRIVAIQDDGSQAVGGTFMCVGRRDGGGNATLVGSVDTSNKNDSAGSPSFTVQADTTAQALDIDVTGEAATNYSWIVTYEYHKIVL